MAVGALVRAAMIGHLAAMLAADEDIDDILLRVGQLMGLSRDLLEKADDDETEKLCCALEEFPNLHIYDGDETTIDDVYDFVDAHGAVDLPSVVVMDSIQTVRTRRSRGLEVRARVDDVMATLKGRTRSGRLITLATSEINRSFYRNVKMLDDLNDLAAFKESGGIEYAAKTAMVLRSHPGTDDTIDVGMAKNRGGKKAVFCLRIDLASTELVEVDLPEEEEVDAKVEKVRRDAEAVYRVVARVPGVGTKVLRAKARLGQEALNRALDLLEEEGRIVNRPVAAGQRVDPHYFACSPGAGEPGRPGASQE